MRLLVVEDEKKYEALKVLMRQYHAEDQAGYEVDTCNDGEEALD